MAAKDRWNTTERFKHDARQRSKENVGTLPCQNEGVEPDICVSQHYDPRSELEIFEAFPLECSPSDQCLAQIVELQNLLCNANAESHPEVR